MFTIDVFYYTRAIYYMQHLYRCCYYFILYRCRRQKRHFINYLYTTTYDEMSRLFLFCCGFCECEILTFRENSPNVNIYCTYKYVIYSLLQIHSLTHTYTHNRSVCPKQYSSRLPPNAWLKTIFYPHHTLIIHNIIFPFNNRPRVYRFG